MTRSTLKRLLQDVKAKKFDVIDLPSFSQLSRHAIRL
jgi:hypothetical protein